MDAGKIESICYGKLGGGAGRGEGIFDRVDVNEAPRPLVRDPTCGFPEEGPQKPSQTPVLTGTTQQEDMTTRAVPIAKKRLIEAAYCVVCDFRINGVAMDGVRCWRGSSDCWTHGRIMHWEPCFHDHLP